jgi:fused signal recognition particle receptor
LLIEAESKLQSGDIGSPSDIPAWLQNSLREILPDSNPSPIRFAEIGPTVLLVVGVNGSGKTTSVAKLVRWLQEQGRRPLIAAADTFRAAAVEQLCIWSERLGVECVRGSDTSDPAAVAHDACARLLSSDADVLVIDTAGRLHTQKNLMSELEKIARIIKRQIPDAPHETLLVMDATTGQNAIQQARRFGESTPLSGVILSKLDGTAKGGAVLGISRELGVPVKFIGLGEQVDDFEVFNSEEFLEALLEPQSVE